uniref:Uncharacterized protein n=2 Tax=Biomphalaria glabrata TaxID=6526 RepID=A0A2C9M8Y6_BIOGL
MLGKTTSTMRILIALVLLMVPAVLGGTRFRELYQQIEEDLKGDMFRDAKDDPSDDDWGDKKAWEEMKGWGEKRSRGWGKSRDDVDEDAKKDLVADFKQFARQQAMKEAEEKEAKAEVYRQMERVQMKKYLSEKMEELTENFEAQRMKFVFQTTVHFLSLCQGGSNAKEMLEELDGGQLGDNVKISMNDTFSGNDTSMAGDTEGSFDGTHLKWFAEMDKPTKIKYLLFGYMMSMCGAAQQMTGEIQLLQLKIDQCRQGVAPCGDLVP